MARGRGEREGGEKVQEKKERRAKIKKGKHGEKKKKTDSGQSILTMF